MSSTNDVPIILSTGRTILRNIWRFGVYIAYYASHGKGKGGGGKNSSRGNVKGRGRGIGPGGKGKGKPKGKKNFGSSGRGSGAKDAVKKDKTDVGKPGFTCWSCGEKGHRQSDCTWKESLVGMANVTYVPEEDTGEYEACILGIWCMLITIFALIVQIYNYVKVLQEFRLTTFLFIQRLH